MTPGDQIAQRLFVALRFDVNAAVVFVADKTGEAEYFGAVLRRLAVINALDFSGNVDRKTFHDEVIERTSNLISAVVDQKLLADNFNVNRSHRLNA